MPHLRTRAALVAAVIGVAAVGCATANPTPDVAEIGHTGGPVQGVHYREVFQPGSGLHWMGVFDGAYQYPVTVRTYIVSRQPRKAADCRRPPGSPLVAIKMVDEAAELELFT